MDSSSMFAWSIFICPDLVTWLGDGGRRRGGLLPRAKPNHCRFQCGKLQVKNWGQSQSIKTTYHLSRKQRKSLEHQIQNNKNSKIIRTTRCSFVPEKCDCTFSRQHKQNNKLVHLKPITTTHFRSREAFFNTYTYTWRFVFGVGCVTRFSRYWYAPELLLSFPYSPFICIYKTLLAHFHS